MYFIFSVTKTTLYPSWKIRVVIALNITLCLSSSVPHWHIKPLHAQWVNEDEASAAERVIFFFKWSGVSKRVFSLNAKWEENNKKRILCSFFFSICVQTTFAYKPKMEIKWETAVKSYSVRVNRAKLTSSFCVFITSFFFLHLVVDTSFFIGTISVPSEAS